LAVYYSELIRDRHCTYESLHPQAMFKCFKLLPQRTQIVFPTNKRGKCQKKLTDILIQSIFFSYVYVNFAYVEFTSHNLKDSYTCYD